MKKTFVTAAAVVFLAAGISFAADHEQMHEMMMKQGGPKTDARTELTIPAPMKVMHKGMMRQHMDTLSEITAALAANDLKKSAEIAKTDLGWSKERGQQCSIFEPVKGGSDFTKLSTDMHKKADEFADAAKAGNRDKALAELSQLMKKCNACHEMYRH
ncbi:MAG TPA: cytochrome c [Nitrospiraceae bacterium]|jgi:cytochrome c556